MSRKVVAKFSCESVTHHIDDGSNGVTFRDPDPEFDDFGAQRGVISRVRKMDPTDNRCEICMRDHVTVEKDEGNSWVRSDLCARCYKAGEDMKEKKKCDTSEWKCQYCNRTDEIVKADGDEWAFGHGYFGQMCVDCFEREIGSRCLKSGD